VTVRVAVVMVSGAGGRVAGTSLAHEGFKPRVQRWRSGEKWNGQYVCSGVEFSNAFFILWMKLGGNHDIQLITTKIIIITCQ